MSRESEFAAALERYARIQHSRPDEAAAIDAEARQSGYREAWRITFAYLNALRMDDPDAANHYADALDEAMEDLRFLWMCDLAEQAIAAKLADGANLGEAIWESVAESEAEHGPRRSLQ